MKKPLSPPPWVKESPWLNKAYDNQIKLELRYIEDPVDTGGYKPLDMLRWIYEKGGVNLLFRGLAYFAPMFPTYGYREQVSQWTSPPPFMSSNVICLVMGHDSAGSLRLVGGNCFKRTAGRAGQPPADQDFFAQYDHATEEAKKELVRQTISLSINEQDKEYLREIESECAQFYTMPVYLAVLTSQGSFFAACPALVDGIKQFDPSSEIFGEVK